MFEMENNAVLNLVIFLDARTKTWDWYVKFGKENIAAFRIMTNLDIVKYIKGSNMGPCFKG